MAPQINSTGKQKVFPDIRPKKVDLLKSHRVELKASHMKVQKAHLQDKLKMSISQINRIEGEEIGESLLINNIDKYWSSGIIPVNKTSSKTNSVIASVSPHSGIISKSRSARSVSKLNSPITDTHSVVTMPDMFFHQTVLLAMPGPRYAFVGNPPMSPSIGYSYAVTNNNRFPKPPGVSAHTTHAMTSNSLHPAKIKGSIQEHFTLSKTINPKLESNNATKIILEPAENNFISSQLTERSNLLNARLSSYDLSPKRSKSPHLQLPVSHEGKKPVGNELHPSRPPDLLVQDEEPPDEALPGAALEADHRTHRRSVSS